MATILQKGVLEFIEDVCVPQLHSRSIVAFDTSMILPFIKNKENLRRSVKVLPVEEINEVLSCWDTIVTLGMLVTIAEFELGVYYAIRADKVFTISRRYRPGEYKLSELVRARNLRDQKKAEKAKEQETETEVKVDSTETEVKVDSTVTDEIVFAASIVLDSDSEPKSL